MYSIIFVGNQLLKTFSLLLLYFRRYFFDGPQNDPNYAPLPEDRPGGFAWGEGRQLQPEQQQQQAEQQQQQQ